MATQRFNYNDKFNLKDQKVGISSNTPEESLDVASGTLKGVDLQSNSGVTTFSTYQGFQNKKTTYTENVTIDTGESGTLSGEVVIGAGLTMNVGTGATTGQGSIESLKVSNTFTPPIGGTNDRPSAPQPGAIFYNKDFKTIEYWDGSFWRQVDNTTTMGRGIWGNGESTENFHFIQITTLGNSEEFGDYLFNHYAGVGAFSNGTRGCWAGGYPANANANKIEYLTIQSKGNALDFGNLTQARDSGGSSSSSTRGVIGGGIYRSPTSATNVIDYVEIATLGDAIDFGDITAGENGAGGEGFSSPTRAIWAGGGYPSYGPYINVVTISTKGNSTKFGEIAVDASYQGCASNNIRGVTAGGMRYSPYRPNALIQYVTMASDGNASDFGDLTLGRHSPMAVCTHVRACFAGGYTQEPSVGQKLIDYIQFASTGNALEFGEISTGTYLSYHNGTSDSHGGLGGF